MFVRVYTLDFNLPKHFVAVGRYLFTTLVLIVSRGLMSIFMHDIEHIMKFTRYSTFFFFMIYLRRLAIFRVQYHPS